MENQRKGNKHLHKKREHPFTVNKVNVLLPGRAGSNTETHVPLLRQGVIPQLPQVLWPKILLSLASHRIFTCRDKADRR